MTDVDDMGAQMIRIGKLLARFRRRAGLSQVQLAEAVGRAPNSISNWELGRVQVYAVTLMQVCYACGTTPGAFFDTLLEEE